MAGKCKFLLIFAYLFEKLDMRGTEKRTLNGHPLRSIYNDCDSIEICLKLHKRYVKK